MCKVDFPRTLSGVPVLRKSDIDDIGESCVREFCPDALQKPQPLDIDLFLQEYLEMDQDFQYLSHNGIYLGMTVFNDTDSIPVYDPVLNRAEYLKVKANTVIIDRRLLDEDQYNRYRFTSAHEAGHGIFHAPVFKIDKNQTSLFDDEEPPPNAILCRVDSYRHPRKKVGEWTDKERMEWQANAFAAAVLMPKTMVGIAVKDLRTDDTNDSFARYGMIVTVASTFRVSTEAAMYRLQSLGYISNEENFSEWNLLK